MTSPDPVTAVLHAAVADGVFPGAVLQVRLRGAVVYHQGVGRITYAVDAPAVTTDTIYDLASLTKPLVTTTALWQLAQSRRLELSQPLEDVWETWRTVPVGRATLEQVLAHSTGLPSWRPYYQRLICHAEPSHPITPRDRATGLVVEWIKAEPLESAPGSCTVYSDLGFMVLGLLVEHLMKTSLAEWWGMHAACPLGLRPLDFIDFPRNADLVFGAEARLAPTEQDSWRGRLLCGEVHDENAWALGGVAGHAGLFGTADAVARLGEWWLEGWLGRDGPDSASLFHRFTSRVASIPSSSRALGWDTPASPASSGRYFSPQSFGHLGFTGTSLWVDPRRELVVALVSNRVHPTRSNDTIKRFRPRLHDVVWEAWVGAG